MTSPFQIYSEIGTLRSVIVKRPGQEVENLTPDTMQDLLFDDIPYLPIIQDEHDAFTKVLRENGTDVLYLEDLVVESLGDNNKKEAFVHKIIEESGIHVLEIVQELSDYLLSMPTKSMVEKVMAGVRNDEVSVDSSALAWLADHQNKSLFLMQPMPSLYYTRDPATVLGEGLAINHMFFQARKRESLFMEIIIQNHPYFKAHEINLFRDRYTKTPIEGGDILVLNEEVVAVGISQRTSGYAIEELAKELFLKGVTFKKVLAIEIPHVRAMMHLDTVFTMVDYDKFTIHPGITRLNGGISIFLLEPGKETDEIRVSHYTDLKKVLKKALKLDDLALIPCGGGDPIAAPREQWNDGSNTLAIKPGVVVTFNRNHVSNRLLREHGVDVLEISSSELSRGRGGPRCMSMPLIRENRIR